MSIATVYETDGCQGCRAVKRWLRSQGVPFNTADATEEATLAWLKEQGFQQAPVTAYGDIIFSGFNPGALFELKAAFEADHPQEGLS